MLERLFPRRVWIFLGIAAAVAFLVGLLGAALRHDSVGSIFLSAIEASVLAFVGGLLARSFISFLLWIGRDAPGVSFLLGWAFFLWPGVIDTIVWLLPRSLVRWPYVTRPVVLLWMATSVGAFTGMMDGMWQTHQWAGPGVVAYALDETWGLAGSTNGDLLHLIDFSWGDHAVGETRTDAHRYQRGLALKPDYTFTQGAVMSDDKYPRSTTLGSQRFRHENTHVWQNRAFGPIFTLSYLVWFVLMTIPGLIYAGASGNNAGDSALGSSYYSQPWETWAYAVQGGVNRTAFGPGIWPDWLVVVVSVPFFLLFLLGFGLIVYRVYRRARAQPQA